MTVRDVAATSTLPLSPVDLALGAVVEVSVPATSANLGPGFDALGLAVTCHDVVRVEVRAHGLSIVVDGEGADEVPHDERHLVVRTLRHGLSALGVHARGLALHCTNRIPHGRGLGSSAAAAVAGLSAARWLAVDAGVEDPGPAWVVAQATAFEGHADNVAPCVLGGFTIAWHGAAGVRAVRARLDPTVVAVAAIPTTSLSTHAARGLLPVSVPHSDAASNAGRSALLMHALADEPAMLWDATEDRLHQQYRESGMPESVGLVRALRRQGIAAVISGAGPTVLALVPRAEQPTVISSMNSVLTEHHDESGWTVRPLDIDGVGVTRLR